MGFTRARDLVDEAYENGQTWYTYFRKLPAIASTQGNWIDLSLAPGNPRANYYVGTPYEATAFTGAYGLYHGGNVSPKTKHLHKLTVMSASAGYVPAVLLLCDYLMYYPLIDMDSTDVQVLTNPITLPRYSDGVGVQAFLIATNPYIGGAGFEINYTNSDGASNRISQPMISNSITTIGTLVNCGPGLTQRTGPFLWINPCDKGIQSVQSIQFNASNGGLASLVLCKPLATIPVCEIFTPTERDFFQQQTIGPRIYDGAYLNFLVLPNGSVVSAQIAGDMTVIWA